MDNIILKTSVDDLYELVKSKNKISVDDAAKILKLPANIIQSLVDFLVEEKIFGIEYKFTTPYIYISEKSRKKNMQALAGDTRQKMVTQKEFYEKASEWKLPQEKIRELWKKYVSENIAQLQDNFYVKARSKNIVEEKINQLWEKYKAEEDIQP